MDKVQLDEFACHKCGQQCPIAPGDDQPGRAVCESCCEDHEYVYDPWRRNKFCIHCDRELFWDNDD